MTADMLALSGERDAQLELRHRAFREGYAMGREDEAAERDAGWNRIARPVARGGQAHAELERIRWTVRGEVRTREDFGRPHPDDYPGQDGQRDRVR